MLIFGMLIVEFQVLLNLKKIHLFCVQSITEMLFYFGDICNFLKSVSMPPIQKKKSCIIVAVGKIIAIHMICMYAVRYTNMEVSYSHFSSFVM